MEFTTGMNPGSAIWRVVRRRYRGKSRQDVSGGIVTDYRGARTIKQCAVGDIFSASTDTPPRFARALQQADASSPARNDVLDQAVKRLKRYRAASDRFPMPVRNRSRNRCWQRDYSPAAYDQDRRRRAVAQLNTRSKRGDA